MRKGEEDHLTLGCQFRGSLSARKGLYSPVDEGIDVCHLHACMTGGR